MGKQPQHKRRRSGFTMVETLVAMAILITVISGVVLVYSGAVRTVRQAYRANDNFEIGRSVLAALQRDLERAFTAREFGKYFQFHGGPQAMSFVGVLEDGQLGRVTYAINRLDTKNDFIMSETQNLQVVFERAMAQISALATGDSLTRLTIAKNFTKRLAVLLAQDGRISLGGLTQSQLITELPLALDAAFVTADADPDGDGKWELEFVRLEDPPASGNYIFAKQGVVDCEVRVKTGYMVRFEEPGVTDLSSFNLPPNPNNPLLAMSFPSIDPASIDSVKNNPLLLDYEAACRGLFDRTVEQQAFGQDLLSCLTYGAIVMPGSGTLEDLDLRQLINGLSPSYSGSYQASYLSSATVSRIFEAQKRDVWLGMFTGGDLPARLFSDGNADSPDNYFEAWRLDDDPSNFATIANNKNPLDYAIAERIVVGGELVTFQDVSAPADAAFFALLNAFDFLGVGAYFTYADEDNKYRETYNTLSDIPGYLTFSDPYNGLDPVERFQVFDIELAEEFAGTIQTQGSPIAPRIPALVSPRFWIMSEGATSSDPPFKRYFDQVVDVPSSARRALPKQFVPDAG